MTEVTQTENTISVLKKFFTPNGEAMSIAEFKDEWDRLSPEEKDWFKTQPLE